MTGWCFNPSEKYQSVGMIIPIYGKIKNVPNHQTDEQTWKAMKIVFKSDENKKIVRTDLGTETLNM